jgi:23S rRNA (pseudouridine1915-N3)-methyltransferase
MRITLAAVGRLGRMAEADLARDWASRATVQGRSLGLGPVDILEVEPRKSGKAAEGEALLEAASMVTAR